MQNNSLSTKNRHGSTARRVIIALFAILIAFSVIRVFVDVAYIKVYIVGSSMCSTFNGAENLNRPGGDYVYAYRTSDPKRGDVVIINTQKKILIKRVIALGGDTVELKGGVLYLNGQIKEEPYVSAENNNPDINNFDAVTVPAGCMFCLGDNRDVSIDSRSEQYGCMPLSWTKGVVADWSVTLKGVVTGVNTFFDFTLPEIFGH